MMEDTPPVPPLTPRKTAVKRVNDLPLPITKLLLPAGNELIIRGIVDPKTQKPRQNPSAYVRKAIKNLLDQEENYFLRSCPVEVDPFSSRADIPSVYVVLTTEFNLTQETACPRFDLLGLWKEKLEKIDEPWEIAWAPQRRRKDKRCWV
jgi:hypothetical protein